MTEENGDDWGTTMAGPGGVWQAAARRPSQIQDRLQEGKVAMLLLVDIDGNIHGVRMQGFQRRDLPVPDDAEEINNAEIQLRIRRFNPTCVTMTISGQPVTVCK